MNPLVLALIGAGVRWLIMLLAARGIYVSDDQSVELISGAAAVAMLLWSWTQKTRADEQLNRR